MTTGDGTLLGDEGDWLCTNCNVPLEISKVEVTYLGSGFPVDLARCPNCGLVYIPEELALGRMLDVEQQLEDK